MGLSHETRKNTSGVGRDLKGGGLRVTNGTKAAGELWENEGDQ